MIDREKYMNLYMLCPARRVTGGVELAHQLCHAINTLTDVKAKIWYTDIDDTRLETLVVNDAIPADYSAYKIECLNDYVEVDKPDNVVVPEGLTDYIDLFDNCKIVLWWMSVDNYIDSTNEMNIDTIAAKTSLHLYQSYYSKKYVERKIPNANGLFLADYINDEHGKFILPAEFRRDIVLYNPRKGYDEIKPFIDKIKWLEWVPLIGMEREKMILVMQMAKIYIDFGNHPGKDRIPREAAANGCCVITNKKGSAAFTEDVAIPEKYKFLNPSDSVDEIETLMQDICANFGVHQKNFDNYRDIIKSEKDKFNEDVIHFAKVIKQL